MDFAIKRVLLKPEDQTDNTREAIREVCRQLENVQARFEMENDSDLIEACIYEMESLRARYRPARPYRKKTAKWRNRR